MISLKDYSREIKLEWNLKNLKSNLEMLEFRILAPEWYAAKSIEDFLKEKGEVRPTGGITRFRGSAIISFQLPLQYNQLSENVGRLSDKVSSIVVGTPGGYSYFALLSSSRKGRK